MYPAERRPSAAASVPDTAVPDGSAHEILVLNAALKGPGKSPTGNSGLTKRPLVMALGSAIIRKRPAKLAVDAIHRRDFIVCPELRHAEIGNPMDLIALDRARRRILPVG